MDYFACYRYIYVYVQLTFKHIPCHGENSKVVCFTHACSGLCLLYLPHILFMCNPCYVCVIQLTCIILCLSRDVPSLWWSWDDGWGRARRAGGTPTRWRVSHTHTQTQTRTHAHTHAHTHTQFSIHMHANQHGICITISTGHSIGKHFKC